MIELIDMSQQDFERYRVHGIEEYAQDLARSLSLSQEQARIEATTSYNDALPNGVGNTTPSTGLRSLKWVYGKDSHRLVQH